MHTCEGEAGYASLRPGVSRGDAGRPPPLAPLAVTHRDYAPDQRRHTPASVSAAGSSTVCGSYFAASVSDESKPAMSDLDDFLSSPGAGAIDCAAHQLATLVALSRRSRRAVGVAVVLTLVVTGCGATEATDRSDRISTTTAAKAVFPTEPMSDEQFYERSCAYIRDTAPRYDVHAGTGDEPFHRFLAMSRLLVGYDDLAPHRQAIFELALRDYIDLNERDPAIAPELPDRC